MNKTKIVFFGTSNIATEILKNLTLSKYLQICLVVTKHTHTPVAKYASENNIECFSPQKFDDNATQKITSTNSDIFAVVDYGRIIPTKILNIPKKGAFNLHFSLLPKYRGASPVQSAILKGDKVSGISIFKLTKNLDEGDIFAKKEIRIENLRADKVFDLMLKISAPLFRKTLENIAENKLSNGIAQDHASATFCGKFTKKSGEIDLEKEEFNELINKINAFYPWPSVYFFHEKYGVVKILDAKKADLKNTDKQNGLFTENKKLYLKLNDGIIEISEIQREGKKAISGEEFARGMQN